MQRLKTQMPMNKCYPLFLLLFVILASCKAKREDVIARKWQETRFSNPQMAQLMQEQRFFMDTMGHGTNTADNLRMYGAANVDSMKGALQRNMDSFDHMMQVAVDSTWYDFNGNGTVYMHSDDGLDSASWYFDEEGGLVLDEMKLKGTGSRLRMEVLALNDTALRLRYSENRSASEAIFAPAKK